MFKSIVVTSIIAIALLLASCTTNLALRTYIDINQGYSFSYPLGWSQVDVANLSSGVDVVFRDAIEHTENLSVIVSKIPQDKSLADLGTPSEIGYRFFKMMENKPDFKRKVEFIKAESLIKGEDNYYILEYEVKLANQQERHDLASAIVKNGKLFTFNISTTKNNWQKKHNLLEIVVKSFTV